MSAFFVFENQRDYFVQRHCFCQAQFQHAISKFSIRRRVESSAVESTVANRAKQIISFQVNFSIFSVTCRGFQLVFRNFKSILQHCDRICICPEFWILLQQIICRIQNHRIKSKAKHIHAISVVDFDQINVVNNRFDCVFDFEI